MQRPLPRWRAALKASKPNSWQSPENGAGKMLALTAMMARD
jgi:hypothetical protein